MAQISKRGSGFLVRVFLGRDANGKRRFHNKTIRGTKKDAEQYAKRIELEVSSGTYGEPSRQLLNDYLDDWLKSHKTSIRPRSFVSYTQLIENYIKPTLGDRELFQLNVAELNALWAGMTARGLSARTVRYTHSVLRKALNDAVVARLLNQNVATFAKLPRKERREMSALSTEEARRFLEKAADSRWHALWVVLLFCGLRPSEGLGLRWTDFDGKQLTIKRTLVHGSTGKAWSFAEPKTSKSRRSVPLPAAAIVALKAHKAKQAAERLRAGSDYSNNDLIFASARGVPPDFACLRRQFKRVCKDAGCKEIRLYDLRHTCASLMLAENVHAKVVSDMLGHSSVALTLDIYSHAQPSMAEDAAQKLDQLLSNAG